MACSSIPRKRAYTYRIANFPVGVSIVKEGATQVWTNSLLLIGLIVLR